MACRSHILVLLAACMPGVGASAADSAEGERLYLAHGCYGCHGYNGTGRVPLANGVGGVTTDDTAFVTYLRLRTDQNPMGASNDMPSYPASSLPDDDALDILAYIRTLEDDPPPVDAIPAFRAILDSVENDEQEQP